MPKALNQVDGHACAESKKDSDPPFLKIADIGHVAELNVDFSLANKGLQAVSK